MRKLRVSKDAIGGSPSQAASPASAHQHAARRIVGDHRAAEERRRATHDDSEGQPIDLSVEGKAYQFDRIGERIEPANGRKPRASLLYAPQRVEGGGSKKHRENDKVHHAGEILELLDERRQK